MQKKKTILMIFGAALLFGVGWYLLPTIFFGKKNVPSGIAGSQSQRSVVGKITIRKTIEVDDATVVAGENLNLSFPFPGKIERLFVVEGDAVKEGDQLAKIETKQLELNLNQLNAGLVKAQALLGKLRAGATKEALAIARAQIDSSKYSLSDAQSGVVAAIRSAYTQSDDAVRGKTNGLFTGIDTGNPQLVFPVSDSGLKNDIQNGRSDLEGKLDDWKEHIDHLKSSDDFNSALDRANDNIKTVHSYLDNLSIAMSTLVPAGGITQDAIDGWETVLSLARSNVDQTQAGIAKASGELDYLKGGNTLAKRQLDLQQADPQVQDLVIAQAQIDDVRSQIDVVNDDIGKSTILAPSDGIVMKYLFKESEMVGSGMPELSFVTSGQKILVDVPEDKIAEIGPGDVVSVRIRAVFSHNVSGKILTIEPQAIMRDGDTYYRTNVLLDKSDPAIRLGMTADVFFVARNSASILGIPRTFVEDRGGRSYVTVVRGGKPEEVEVEKGIFDDMSVEIKSGLAEGDSVVSRQGS